MLANYPNPFKTETAIPFKLFYPSNVTIDFYDLKGTNIGRLINEDLNIGDHTCLVDLKKNNIGLAPEIMQTS